MKKENNDAEQRLLKNTSIDELIKIKMEEELKAEFEKAHQKIEKQVITEISKVPTHLIFSKQAVYKIFNKKNKTESRINGIQAEALLGMQTSMRAKIKSGEIDAFSTDSAYVKFEKITV